MYLRPARTLAQWRMRRARGRGTVARRGADGQRRAWRWKMPLARARLGQSDLEITRVGVGTAPIGSTAEWRINWGPQDEGDAIRAIQTALDAGVNWIDTAPFYGWGRAERLGGGAPAGRGGPGYRFANSRTLRGDRGGRHRDLSPSRQRSAR